MGGSSKSIRGHLATSSTTNWQNELETQLGAQRPFSLLPPERFRGWIQNSKRVRFETGDQLIRPDELYSDTILVLKGDVRLIAFGDESEGPFSLGKRGPGQLLGWASLLRGESTEFQAAQK